MTSFPVLATLILHESMLETDHNAEVIALCGIALLYAALTRLVSERRRLGGILAWAAFLLALGPGFVDEPGVAVVGAVGFVLSLVLLLAVPLSSRVPRLEGVTLWITVAAVGLIAILAAALLEQGRSRVRLAIRRLGELTADWE